MVYLSKMPKQGSRIRPFLEDAVNTGKYKTIGWVNQVELIFFVLYIHKRKKNCPSYYNDPARDWHNLSNNKNQKSDSQLKENFKAAVKSCKFVEELKDLSTKEKHLYRFKDNMLQDNHHTNIAQLSPESGYETDREHDEKLQIQTVSSEVKVMAINYADANQLGLSHVYREVDFCESNMEHDFQEAVEMVFENMCGEIGMPVKAYYEARQLLKNSIEDFSKLAYPGISIDGAVEDDCIHNLIEQCTSEVQIDYETIVLQVERGVSLVNNLEDNLKEFLDDNQETQIMSNLVLAMGRPYAVAYKEISPLEYSMLNVFGKIPLGFDGAFYAVLHVENSMYSVGFRKLDLMAYSGLQNHGDFQ